MNEDRILAYKKAMVFTEDMLSEVTGGGDAKGSRNHTTKLTGNPPNDAELIQIYD